MQNALMKTMKTQLNKIMKKIKTLKQNLPKKQNC